MISVRLLARYLEIIEKMIKYNIASNRSEALIILIEKGLDSVLEEIEFWENVYRRVEELKREGKFFEHGKLYKLLEKESSIRVI